MVSPQRRTKDHMSCSRRRRSTVTGASGDNDVTFSVAKRHQYVWVSADLVETALKSGGTLPNTWEHKQRNRSTSSEWGWCRAIVVSSAVVKPDSDTVATPAEENDSSSSNSSGKASPFGQFTLRKCAISPPVNSRNSSVHKAAVSSLPWDSTPKQPTLQQKTVSMTITVDDNEFAPDHLQDVTVSFTYTTAENGLSTADSTDHQRVCLANAWWTNSSDESGGAPPTDLTTLEQLHEPAVVYCLLRRYLENQIYTYTGKILLALNPFQNLNHMYGEPVMQEYWQHAKQLGTAATSDRNSISSRPPPHVYAIAEDAYRSALRSLQDGSMLRSNSCKGEDQSILVSGESGAGKTVTTKIILQYLTVLSQQSDKSAMTVSGIESQVLESNPILESFGNARTVRNDNSSRFGKFLDMKFESTGCLSSASIETYLLEKVRLISQAPGERNYHVFYEVLSGLSPHERRTLHMIGRSAKDFSMTCTSGTFDRRDGVSDGETFKELRNAFDTVGFVRSEQNDLFTVTCALLYTSNLTFAEESADASVLDSSNPSLRYAVDLLGVDVGALNHAVCKCAIEARGETLYKHLSIDRAEKAVQALIKTTYGALFTYIVRKINSFIAVRQDKPDGLKNGGTTGASASIGVLDIFGFESFETNSFEQLCINYCNEALQQQFNRFVFKLEQQEYQKEGIDWSFIEFPDNQDVLDLIEKRHEGILSVLDEQSRLPRCTDATFASAVYQKCFDHPRFETTKAMKAQLSFAIHHYAGLVEYDTEGFLEKNRDELSNETTDLLKSSSNPFIAMLGRDLSGGSSDGGQAFMIPSRSPKKGTKTVQRTSSSLLRESVGTQFCSQLKLLRTRIEATSPHYVRCLKPNDGLQPHSFDALVIADQLRCAGVLEAVRVSRVGFPNRYFHDHFVQRFGLLEPTILTQVKQKMAGRELCSYLVDLLSPSLERILDSVDDESAPFPYGQGRLFLGVQVGKTKVFIRRRAFEALEYMRTRKQEDSAVLIQSTTRMFLNKINYEITLFAVTLLQKFVRRIGAFRLARDLRTQRSAQLIQMSYRSGKARKKLRAAQWIACWCQSAHRGAIARQYCAYVFLDNKASSIQRMWRNYKSTKAFRKVKLGVLAIQTVYRSHQAKQTLRQLRLEARDLSLVAAERDKFKEESMRLRKELEQVKLSPELPVKPPPSPGRAREIEKLRQEVLTLNVELEKAHRMTSPSKSVSERADELAQELARREEELASLRQEINVLRSRDDHSSRSYSGHGSFSIPSPRHRSSPVRSDVSLLDDEIEDDLPAIPGAKHDGPSDEVRHLHTSIRQKNKRHLEQVLQQTSEVCVLINQVDKYGRTAMHLAALSLDLEIAELLVTKGAVVNAQDDDGETPLHLAESASMAELLLTKGKANPNIPNVDGICALHLAVQRRDVDSVRVLVMNNANVNNADNIRWFTPLHLIALPARTEGGEKPDESNRCHIAHLLTGVYGPNKPELDYQDSEGNSPLHYAVQLDSEDACELVNVFLEKGADPNIRNMRDQVPFHLLCHNDNLMARKNYHEIVAVLLQHHADPSVQSRTGCTALHLSLYHKDLTTARQLVNGGAELHAVWRKPKRWAAFWIEKDGASVLPLDMVESQDDLREILTAISAPHKPATTRSSCMQCGSSLRFTRSVHCKHCSRLVCGKCSSVRLPAIYFLKEFNVTEPSWACVVCENILTAKKEVTSNGTQPTSSYGEDAEDEEDRYSC